MTDATRPTSPSNATGGGGKPARAFSTTGNPAAAAALADAAAADDGGAGARPSSGSVAATDATRPASPSSAGGEPAKTAEPTRASVSGAPAVQDAPRPASASVSGGDAKAAETRPPSASTLGSVPENAVASRASVAKSSPAPADPAPAAAAAAVPAAAPAASNAGGGVTAANGGGSAATSKALADRADKKDQLSGGDKQISKPRPVEDVKRELEQGTARCTDAWFNKTDAFQALAVTDGTVKYMGFVNDAGATSALFYVDGSKTGTSAATAKADEKCFRLLKLSSLPDTKEEVKLMYTSSPIVLAAAAGHGALVKLLIDRFGLDPTVQQTVYTAVWDATAGRWSVDNSQGKKVSAGEVAAANGFEDVAQTGGCRMCAGGDCVIA